MSGWADDPELVATFRVEVEERLASLGAGLLALESHPAPRQVVASLFRDAHTIKGSARMLAATDVLRLAHATEDLLGALRDGRLEVRRDLIDVLLAATDAMARAMPGVGDALPAAAFEPVIEALSTALAGEAVSVPVVSDLSNHDFDDDEEPRLGPANESVRVDVRKVHNLVDAVGEAELDARRCQRLADSLARLAQQGARLAKPTDGEGDAETMRELARLVDELALGARGLREVAEEAAGALAGVRDQSMALAMVPLGRVLAGLPRLVREVAAATGKDVRLELSGESVELDKGVLDGISDALRHLVTNAVDHGCEPPAARRAAGKPTQATVRIAARSSGGTVTVEVSDDGAGIAEAAVRDRAIRSGLLPEGSELSGAALFDLLFASGLSTAAEVTETSGRGVGLDVVRVAVAGLGGRVEVRSVPGAGTTFALTLPLALGVLRCLLARVGAERYALPVPGVVESVSLRDEPVHHLGGEPVIVRHGVAIPLLVLADALGVAASAPAAAVVVRHGEQVVAWAVDRLEGESELVVKDLGGFLGRLPAVTGATIDGDGSVVCLVDLRELSGRSRPVAGLPAPRSAAGDELKSSLRRARVLVVEDSVGVRELQRAILESAGYEVVTAVDGLDGAARLSDDPVDLVLSDVEMPGLDGFALTRRIRGTPRWEQVPVIIMTSRGDARDQRAGLDAGADAYLLKSQFDQQQLLATVERLAGRARAQTPSA